MNDFELGGRKFKVGKLNAFKQFHLVRRLAPILADLLPTLREVQKLPKGKSESENFDETAKVLAPILTGLSKLSDADSEFILFGLLSCVEVQIGQTWTKMANESMLMVQDMELPALLQIAGQSFMANLSNFFAVLPATSPGAR
jgi:hypothetical protein